MQNLILNLTDVAPNFGQVNAALSFRPFINYIRQRAKDDTSFKAQFYEYILEKFSAYPELEHPIEPEDSVKYKEILNLIYITLVPAISNEKETLWALSRPLAPVIIFGTDSFYSMMADGTTQTIKRTLFKVDLEEKSKHAQELVYSFVLRKLYDFNFIFKNEMVHSIHDEESGLIKHYRFDLDDRFIEITHDGPLPPLNFEALQSNLHGHMNLEMLQKMMPLSMFRFEGMAVLSINDVTEQYAIENIKNIILNQNPVEDELNYDRVIKALQSLAGNTDIHFGLLPILKVNGKLIFDDNTCMHSKLITNARRFGIAEQAYMNVADKYFTHPKLVFYKNITDEIVHKNVFLKHLKNDGVRSYSLVPIFYNKNLAGVLEIYSTKEGLLQENFFSRIESAIPLVAQLLQNNIESFNSQIDAIVKQKFTSLQPAVQWKFNETAWHFLRDCFKDGKRAEIESIIFKKVYPLYGAIDIRNSTVERNNALKADLQTRFSILIETLMDLKTKTGLVIINEKIFLCRKWEKQINEATASVNETELNNFLEIEMHEFLTYFKQNHPDAASIIDHYFESITEDKGAANQNKRDLEFSMHHINNTINAYLESTKDNLQSSYPCYFEKFRTDGIEYDIYVGQSIAPDKPFNILYFHNLRLWQLNSMAEIARLSNSLLEKMKRPLYTTQLIFIHPGTIDISFRNDERRFDVEGSYNIRYQVIKKRIDKVRLKNKPERLTQPGKIAMVYFNSADAEEYVKYIQFMQEESILEDDLEYLELESLQGLTGLKALRVGVNMNYTKP